MNECKFNNLTDIDISAVGATEIKYILLKSVAIAFRDIRFANISIRLWTFY